MGVFNNMNIKMKDKSLFSLVNPTANPNFSTDDAASAPIQEPMETSYDDSRGGIFSAVKFVYRAYKVIVKSGKAKKAYDAAKSVMNFISPSYDKLAKKAGNSIKDAISNLVVFSLPSQASFASEGFA
jgi:hypothetical protein